MKYKYTCEACGFTEIIPENAAHYEYKCVCCLEMVQLQEIPEVETDNTNVITEKTAIMQITKEIEQLGNKRVYEIVEAIGDAKIRAKYRLNFIRAGGLIPENIVWTSDIRGKFYLK